MIEPFGKMSIIQIGAGGTGSWLAPAITKLLGSITTRVSPEVFGFKYVIVDDDFIEERNIIRQNFTRDDIHKSKSAALVRQHGRSFKHIESIHQRINKPSDFKEVLDYKSFTTLGPRDKKRLIIFLNCVDNNKSRLLIYKNIKKSGEPTILIDGGNNLHSGQVVQAWFNLPEGCLQNDDQKPINYTKLFSVKNESVQEQSCAFFAEGQSLSANLTSATTMFNCFSSIVINKALLANCIQFNTSGYSYFQF